MNQTDIRRCVDWLKAHQEKTIAIRKVEDGDVDRIHIMIKDVEFGDMEQKPFDDYTDTAAILVRGIGEIETDRGFVPLPDGSYVIPVEGHMLLQLKEQELRMETARAVYHMEEKRD